MLLGYNCYYKNNGARVWAVFQMALAEPDSWRHEKLPWPKAYRDLQMYERTATPQVSG